MPVDYKNLKSRNSSGNSSTQADSDSNSRSSSPSSILGAVEPEPRSELPPYSETIDMPVWIVPSSLEMLQQENTKVPISLSSVCFDEPRVQMPLPDPKVQISLLNLCADKDPVAKSKDLDAVIDASLVPPPPTQPPSVGSIGHPQSCAVGCKYQHKPAGCKDGKLCSRCHLCRWSRSSVTRKTKPASDASKAKAAGTPLLLAGIL